MHAVRQLRSLPDLDRRRPRGRGTLDAVVRRWEAVGAPTPRRLHELGRQLAAMDVPLREMGRLASDLMWCHRGRRLPAGPGELPAAARDDDSAAARFLYYCMLRHANYLFDFVTCHSFATEAQRRWPDDLLIAALLGFAELGCGDPGGDDRLQQVLARSRDTKVQQVALTAYAACLHHPGAAHRLLELTNRMRDDGHHDAILHYRTATAHRWLGNFTAALEATTDALHELAIGQYDEATRPVVNEQIRQERERILEDMRDRVLAWPVPPRHDRPG